MSKKMKHKLNINLKDNKRSQENHQINLQMIRFKITKQVKNKIFKVIKYIKTNKNKYTPFKFKMNKMDFKINFLIKILMRI